MNNFELCVALRSTAAMLALYSKSFDQIENIRRGVLSTLLQLAADRLETKQFHVSAEGGS